MEHLMNIDSDVVSINLNLKDIYDGVLDFKKFNKLKKLECCRTFIASVINLPSTLEFLDISYNNITSLNNLPPSLIYLDCSYNNIKTLNNLPISLKKLNSIGNCTLVFDADSPLEYEHYGREEEKDNLIKLTNLPISLNSIGINYEQEYTFLEDVLNYNNNEIVIHLKHRKIRKVLEENMMRLYL